MKHYQLPKEVRSCFPHRSISKVMSAKYRSERKVFGEQIKQLRDIHQWTLIEAMNKTQMPIGISLIHRMELGIFKTDIHDLQQIAYAYGKKLKIIFEDVKTSEQDSFLRN